MLTLFKYLLENKPRCFKVGDKVRILSVNSIIKRLNDFIVFNPLVIEEIFLGKEGAVEYNDMYGICVRTFDGCSNIFQENELAKIG